jgi:pyruvate dehydrogenase E2 component (dihydrolipoamide acetyltransferase)
MRIYTVTLPDIGEGVVEGEVIEWLKNVGDQVTQDEPVVVVMTDKATVELPSPYPGKIVKHYFKPGEISIKGKPLYDLELAEGIAAIPKQQAKFKENVSSKNLDVPDVKPVKCPKTCAEVLALPSTRRLAQEMGIDIEQVTATGRGSRITPEDLRRHIKTESAEISSTAVSRIISLPGDERVPIVGIKSLMSRRMIESKRHIPHFSYFEKVDATRLVRVREKFKDEGAKQNRKVTYMPFLIRALCLALKKFPQFNGSVDGNHLIIHHQYNVGVAMASPFGLIVPVMKNVQDLSLIDIIHAYEELKARAAANKLHSQEMKEGTITISNFGVLGDGGLWATPIINYPEVAILAVNRIQKQPMVRNDEVVVREVLNLSWSFDHRIIDGDQAGDFSHYYTGLIENPAALL